MVSALDSGSDGTALCSWARHFTPIVPLSTQVYKWDTGEFTAGGNMLQKPEISAGLMGH